MDEHWSNGQWVYSGRTISTYDASNNVLTYLYEQWSNGQWVGINRITWTYDANSNELTVLEEQWSANEWVNFGRGTWTYDAQGNLTSFWFYGWVNSSWTPSDAWRWACTDSAGNYYAYLGYNFTLARRLIVTGVASQSGNVPAVYSLSQNYPNPFNPSTTIRYGLPNRSRVSLTVYNTLGQQVALLPNGEQEAGYHDVQFDGNGLSSGVYFCRLRAGDFIQTRRILLLR